MSLLRRTLASCTCAIIASLAVVALPATAQMQTQASMNEFKAIDTDGDAKLDRNELTAAAKRDFARLDIDHDGYLTRAELEKTHSEKLLLPLPGHLDTATAFAAADTDHDRKIDEHEYVTTVVTAYMSCDRNHDGTIEMSDLKHCSL